MQDIIEINIDQPGKLFIQLPCYKDPLAVKCSVFYEDEQGKRYYFFSFHEKVFQMNKVEIAQAVLDHSKLMIDRVLKGEYEQPSTINLFL